MPRTQYQLYHSIEKYLRTMPWLRLLHGLVVVLASANAELVLQSRCLSRPLRWKCTTCRCYAACAESRVLLPGYFQLLQRRGCDVSGES